MSLFAKTDAAAAIKPPGPSPWPGDLACPAFDAESSPFPEDLPPSPTAPAGATPGTFALTSTGEATYTIPLTVPPGRAGLAPSLALTYDSAAGNGLLGMGFSISGFSAVTRCPQTMAQDGRIQEVTYGPQDPLCLDGKRLVVVGAESGVVEYRTFPDTFRKVLAFFPQGWEHDRGPASLRVFTKNGLVADYGSTPSGQVLGKNGVIRAWWINQIQDRRGNTIDFSYRNDLDPIDHHTVEHTPLRIDYTGHPKQAASRAVVFQTEPRASQDVRTIFSQGMALRSSLQLSKIQMFGRGDALVREYRLTYDLGPATGRTRLTQVEECAADQTCKPPTRFFWNGGQPGFHAVNTPIRTPLSTLVSPLLADVTGDGRDDLVVPDVEQVSGIGEIPITDWVVAPNIASLPAPTSYFDAAASALEEQHFGDIPLPVQPELGTPIDYNDDGRTDFFLHDVHGNFSDWMILLATPDHKLELFDTGLIHPLGLGVASPVHLSDHDVSAHLADYNGDGIADLIQCRNDGITFRWDVHFWSPDGPGWSTDATAILALLGYPCNTPLFTVDVNNDGKVDLVVRKSHWTSNGPVFEGSYETVSLAQDDLANVADTQLPLVAPGGSLVFLDLNGDGLPDAVESGFGDRQLRTFFNTGAGFAPPVQSLTTPILEADKFIQLATPIDYNGDGRQDLLLPLQPATNEVPAWRILQATGSVGDGTFTLVDPGIPFDAQFLGESITPVDPHAPRVGDLDNDGDQDVVLPLNDYFQVFASLAADQDLLSLVSDGMNGHDPGDPAFMPNLVILYDHLADGSTRDGQPQDDRGREEALYLPRDARTDDCSYPRRCVVGSRRVVSGYGLNTGHDQLRSFSVRYRDGRYHRLGRGFLGFGERLVVDTATGAGTAEFYDNVTFDPDRQTYPYAGQVVRTWRYNPGLPDQPEPDQVELQYTEIERTTVPTYDGVTYFTLPVGRNERREQGSFHTGSGMKVEQYVRATEQSAATMLSGSSWIVDDFDSFGNVITEKTITTGEDLTTTVHRVFQSDETSWRIGELSSEQACSSALWLTQCRTTSRTYNIHGEVHTETHGSDDGDPETQLSLRFERDGFGNITQTTAHDAFGNERSACTSYDGEGVFPYAQRNPAGHLTYAKYNPGLGVQTATIDANGLITQWAHDGFGRTTLEIRPDQTSTTYLWTRTKDGGDQGDAWNVKLETKTPGGEDDTVEFDLFGRAIRTWSQGVQAVGAPKPPRILREIAFDALGEHVARRFVPTSEQTPPSSRAYEEFAYDSLGRVVRHIAPWKGVTSYTYDGSTVHVTGPRGYTSSIHNDALGRPASIEDGEGGVTSYVYGPFGVLWMVTDPGGVATVMQRDAYGRVRVHVDPDRGTTVAHYNGFGEQTSSFDALGRSIGLSYDPLGRLTTREDVDGTTTWAWDTATHGVGKIARVTSPAGHEEAFTYDDKSRLQTTSLSLAQETFTSTLTYDSFGRVDTIDYPVPAHVRPFTVRQKYDSHGHVRQVQDSRSGDPYWTLSAADGAGRILTETFGNKVVTSRSYFEDKNRVKSILTTNDHWKVQELSYDYDDALNLTRRTDGLQFATETFGYDGLDRLTCVSLAPSVACAPHYAYAPDGNIREKTDVGTYTYDPQHPHAVQTAGAATFEYDAVGNQRSRPGATVTYTAFDLPKAFTLSQGSGAITLDYDGEGRRIRKTTPEEVTVSVGDLYERVTDLKTGGIQHRFYVYSPERLVAIFTRDTSKPGEMRYVHVDALGSIDALTDPAQIVRERRSYDASGARRNPSWGNPGPSPYAAETTRGFTGHEDDAELGLVNMSARLYDPKVGRFLTPDPVVSLPHFGQSWNGFSYALNNPLSYVDPSGLDETAPGGGATDPGAPGLTLGPDGELCCAVIHGIKPPRPPPPPAPERADQNPNAEGAQVRAYPVPADTGVSGSPAGYVPGPTSATPEQSTASKVGFTALGAVAGLGEMMLDSQKSLLLNVVTLGTYGVYRFWSGLWAGYQEDGLLGALNTLNPLYAIGRNGADAYLAADRGDYAAAGAAGAKAVALTAVVVGTAVVGAGAAATEGAAAEAAASGEVAPAAGEAVSAANPTRGGTYVLRDPVTGQVMRSGRTNNFARRAAEHGRDPVLRELEFEQMHRTDVYAEQRGLEQILHDEHSPPLNKIAPISPGNPFRTIYLEAARRFLDKR